MKIDTLFFDLDETLYPQNCAIWHKIGHNMNQFIMNTFDMPLEQAISFREDLYKKHGTTARGLTVEHGINPIDFLKAVHDIDAQRYIMPNLDLKIKLERIPYRKVIFTNSDRFYATGVLRALKIADCFAGIIDALDILPNCKPMENAFEKALQISYVTDIHACVLLDDQPFNITTAHKVGMKTVQVGLRPLSPDADYQIDTINDLIQIDFLSQFSHTNKL